MSTKQNGPHKDEPQKFHTADSITLDGAARQLIQFAMNGRKGKIPLAWLVGILRHQGFTRARIDRAINDYIIAGHGFFVIHEVRRRESRLEIWRAWK